MIEGELEYVRRNKEFQALMEVIKGLRPRYIFGAGDYCARIHALAPEIEWDGILDNDARKQADSEDIFPPSYIKGKDAYVVIPSFEYYDEMAGELEALGVSSDHIIDARIIYHLTDGQQYFDLEYLDYSAMRTFIDGGSYNGQTAIRFSEMADQVGKVYCFEADRKNIARLEGRLSALNAFPYEVVPKGIWDRDTVLRFSESGTGSSYIIEDDSISGDAVDSIEVTAIDRVIGNEKIDMIKFDIEGSELKGLIGCENMIKNCHPVLAICVYHKPEDIYEIPSVILGMDDSYRLYLRHYSFCQNETVLYYEDRFNASNSHLLVQKYETVSIPAGDGFGAELNRVLKAADGWILFVDGEGEPSGAAATGAGSASDAAETGGAAGANDAAKEKAVSEINELIGKYILNPGTMHVGKGYYFFSKYALSLRRFGFDRIAHAKSIDDIVNAWQKEKVVPLSDINELTKWKRDSIVPGDRYVIWGTSLSGSFIADAVEHSGGKLMFAVDIDPGKEGKDFYGYKTYLPSYLKEHMDDFDHLLIGHYSRFEEIRSQALEVGVPDEKIVRPYEV